MDISVGDRATRSLTLTAEHVAGFAELSGDRNPLHFDEDFVAATPFGRLVVQGGLTTGLLHALVAMDMPGPGTVFMSQEWKFTAPVFVDDTITAEAEVLKTHETKPSHSWGSPSGVRTGRRCWRERRGATRSRGPSDPRAASDPGWTPGFRQAPDTRQVPGPSGPCDPAGPPGMPLFAAHRPCPERS